MESSVRRVGKGALAPCPPSFFVPVMVGTPPDASRPVTLPTLRQRTRGAPCTGVAAGDHPVDHTGDDAGARHDLEMAADDAVEAQGGGIERHEAEIAGKTDHAA